MKKDARNALFLLSASTIIRNNRTQFECLVTVNQWLSDDDIVVVYDSNWCEDIKLQNKGEYLLFNTRYNVINTQNTQRK